MNIVAISGTYRKGKTIDTLMDKAVEGIKSTDPEAIIHRISLIEKHIEYCKNCEACKKVDPEALISKCIIKDDMNEIYPLLDQADGYIFGTPVNCGHETAVMKAFFERMVWVLAKPGKTFPVDGCPVPRNPRKKKAIAIVSAGTVPTILRCFCDDATSLIRSVCEVSLNARLIGSIYAGAIHTTGVEKYLDEAFQLGKKLTI